MRPEDFIAAPCACGACQQANVTQLEVRRDPRSGRWLHGYELKRWYEARQAAREAFRQWTKREMLKLSEAERAAIQESGE